MILDTSMIKQGWANGKVIFFSPPILPLKLTDARLEALRDKKTPHVCGVEKLAYYIIRRIENVKPLRSFF
jgi:hypothetical protein